MDPKELERLKNLKGQMRGDLLKTDAAYVSKTVGKEAATKLQQATRELGWEIDYPNLKTMGWYPIGLLAIDLLAVQKAFGWGEKEVFDIGNITPKYSFLASMMMRYFVSLERVIKEIPKYWRMHFSVGKFESGKYKTGQKFLVLKLEKFDVHPLACVVISGYALRVTQFVVRSEKITIKETKCVHKGDPYHEFLIEWE